MNKDEARSFFSQEKRKLSSSDIEKLSFQIFNRWKNSDFIFFNTFHIFLPIKEKREVNTHFFIEFLWEKNKKVYCPKVEKEHLLHYNLTPQTILKENSWGIPEPHNQENIELQKIDCIFIPLLAYDLQGNRVGYGKGYYDQFLKNFPYAKKIGLSFFNPITEVEGILTSDISLDYIVTPNYFLKFPMEEK